MYDRPGTVPSEGTTIECVVEIPRGARNKYEFDEHRGIIRLDRVLYSSVHYPTDYGFIPNTLAPDGDHLDILIIVEEPTFPGCYVEVRPIGVLNMIDEKGEDQKILAVPVGDPRFDRVQDIDHISPHWLREIENFFDTYKNLEEAATLIIGWDHAGPARQAIDECSKRWADNQSSDSKGE
ncbi:MAG TPA: inorganic diphosphatase [Armatimonadota bacterium]|nr:inorganic diphosphatase [Armatimonadota bacterium]HOM72101.1 inorganic diphosphatase [Armatimonadota bacterium]HOP79570.1 inorganic diphosphatase [Armatimonadota bacterium]HPP75943.1 inorganic diphosphatase [Armatimonadota bacterium]